MYLYIRVLHEAVAQITNVTIHSSFIWGDWHNPRDHDQGMVSLLPSNSVVKRAKFRDRMLGFPKKLLEALFELQQYKAKT